MALVIVRSIEEIRARVKDARSKGLKTCVVPTMGGLHAGHLSLVKRAAEVADFVIVTLFVNPTQFNNPDDFETYPGNEAEDLKVLEKTGTNIVFAPDAKTVYPPGFSTEITVGAASGILCDAHRPGHFDGVTTVVAKLFLQTQADYACFGEKDFQQLFLIRRLVEDLNIPIEIVPVETIRENGGLALSSRNRRLSDKALKIAPHLNKEMRKTLDRIKSGDNFDSAKSDSLQALEEHGFKIEYFELRTEDTLELTQGNERPARLFAAAWLENVRLIDNSAL